LCLSVEYEDRSQELGSGRILFWMKELDELKEAHSVPLQKKKKKKKKNQKRRCPIQVPQESRKLGGVKFKLGKK